MHRLRASTAGSGWRGALRNHEADDLRKRGAGQRLARQLAAGLSSARERRVHGNGAEVRDLPRSCHVACA